MYSPNKNLLMESFTYIGIIIGLPLIIWFSVFNGHYLVLVFGIIFAVGGRFLGHALDIFVENNIKKNKKRK